MPYKPIDFDLVAALRSDINVVKNMAENKHISFDIYLPETAIITADKNMLTTVIRNMLTNAVKFTGEGGKIELVILSNNDKYTDQDVNNDWQNDAKKWRISVFDSGIGISTTQQQTLFDLNQQSTAGTRGERGTGLGLIVCREFLEKHGIRLNVESEVGKGSKFWFEV
jgi:signal transduction histidine kinase